MKKTIYALMAVAISLSFVSCDKSPEGYAKRRVKVMTEMAELEAAAYEKATEEQDTEFIKQYHKAAEDLLDNDSEVKELESRYEELSKKVREMSKK